MKHLLLFLLLCCSAQVIQAQVLEGIVADAESGQALPAVVVTNKTRNQSSMSDADGKYSIAAAKGDNIEFVYLGYFPFDLLMPEGNNVFRRVGMQKKLFSLEEVEIRPDWTPYQLDSMKRRSRYALELAHDRASSSVLGSVFHPMSALAEQFSKKTKQRTRFQHNFVKWENQKFVDTRYTPEEVSSLTNLTGDSLAVFMNSYPMPTDYARAATDLEIKMWIKYNYREWIRKPIVMPPPIPKETADTLKKP